MKGDQDSDMKRDPDVPELQVKFNFHGNIEPHQQRIYELANREDLRTLEKLFIPYLHHPLQSITYEVFDNLEEKQAADPNHSISKASARWETNTIYFYWGKKGDAHFPHEQVHLFAHCLGAPYEWEAELNDANGGTFSKKIPMVSTSLMQEGLAVACDDMVFGRKIHENGRWENLDTLVSEITDWSFVKPELLTFAGFCEADNAKVIPFIAYFTKYLINRFGFAKYKELYISQREIDTVEENNRKFVQIFGNDFMQLAQHCTKTQANVSVPD